MRRTLIRARDMTAMPWKNGGGVTTEIAARPAGAGLDDFAWRVSIADVAASGPFSRFPGIDRIIAVITGSGMTLRSPDGDTVLRPLEPHAFAGETAIDGILPGGPVRDFNVMTRRGRARAWLSIERGPLAPARGGTLLLFCLRGAVAEAAAGDALLFEGLAPGAALDLAPEPGGILVRADIS